MREAQRARALAHVLEKFESEQRFVRAARREPCDARMSTQEYHGYGRTRKRASNAPLRRCPRTSPVPVPMWAVIGQSR